MKQAVKKHPGVTGFLIGLLIGMIFMMYLINRTSMPFYKIGACTFNENRTCGYDCPDWNGECTAAVTDACCRDVRECSGTTDNPNDCYAKYCWAEDSMCAPIYQLNGLFACQCSSVSEALMR